MWARTSKYKLGARAGKYRFEARAGDQGAIKGSSTGKYIYPIFVRILYKENFIVITPFKKGTIKYIIASTMESAFFSAPSIVTRLRLLQIQFIIFNSFCKLQKISVLNKVNHFLLI